jgi:hypothetical protein
LDTGVEGLLCQPQGQAGENPKGSIDYGSFSLPFPALSYGLLHSIIIFQCFPALRANWFIDAEKLDLSCGLSLVHS